MWRAGLGALWSHWRRRPLQLAALVLGLALATALWSGVQAINAEARASYDAAARALGGARFAQLLPTAGDEVPVEDFAALRRAGWMVSPVLEGRIELGGRSYRLVGFDPMTAPRGLAPEDVLGGGDAAAFLAPPFQVLASPADAERVRAAARAGVLVAPSLAPGLLLADLSAAGEWLGRPGAISRLVLAPDAPEGLAPIGEVAPGLEARPPGEGSDVARLTDSFHLNLAAFGLLGFAVGLFIVHGAVSLAFEQRRELFRTLRALGMPLRALLALAAAELAALGAASGALGVALGYAVAAALLPDVAATLGGLYGAELDGALSLRPEWWAAGMGMAAAGIALSSAGAFARLARAPLPAPSIPRAWTLAAERRIRLHVPAALALAAAALAARQVPGLVAGFAFLGALLLASALLLPVLLRLALRAAGALARGPVAEWFWADSRQQLPGLSLALMALLLALAANVGVGAMVSGFRLTFTGYLDQRFAAELYVRARDGAEAEAVRAFLEPRAEAVLPSWRAKARIAGMPAEIRGVADHATYRDHWPVLAALPDAWDRVAAGEGAMVNEQLARRAGLAPGDPLVLGGGWRIEVAGVYGDYGNASAQVLVAHESLAGRFADIDRTRLGVRTDAPDALRRELAGALGLGPAQVADQAAIKAASLRVFERTFAVTAALNALTLAVAGFAILASLLTLSAMRLPQLAPAWALGVPRRRLVRLELARVLALALLTAAAAVPVGLLLAWTLVAVINVEAFGWRLPLHAFPLDWLRLGALSLLAAALAAWLPARRLARMEPSDMLKAFRVDR